MGSDLSLLKEGARNMNREKRRVSLMKLACNWRYQYFQDRDQGKCIEIDKNIYLFMHVLRASLVAQQ